jgi:hypothetical protein
MPSVLLVPKPFVAASTEYKVVHILACLARLDAVASQRGKSDRVSINSKDHFQVLILSPRSFVGVVLWHVVSAVSLLRVCPLQAAISIRVEPASGASTGVPGNLLQLARS